MEPTFHRMSELFRQLGLPDDPAAIEDFLARHRPLPLGLALPEASFWTPSQAALLRDKLAEDADWAELIDELAAMLSG